MRSTHLHSSDTWLSPRDFARIADISVRAATAALRRASSGESWNGHLLQVRTRRGRGGFCGLRYELFSGSLPAPLRLKYERELGSILPVPSPVATIMPPPADGGQWQRRLALLQPAIDAHQDGKTISKVLRSVASQPGAPSFDTLKNWWIAYKKRGIAGLQRKSRSDARTRAVLISKEWEAATISLPPEIRGKIMAEIEKRVRSLYAAGAPSRRQVAQLTMPHLIELTRAAGVEMSDSEARRVCRVPEHFARRGRDHRIIAIKDQDAKRYFDKFTPRIRRDRSHLLPMEYVAGDVHHVDVQYQREDGSTATPKLIAWVDLATNRLFASVEFFKPGKMVRQEHVISSFIEMTSAWGMPSRLYLDNGSEYGWTEFIEDALKCAAFTGRELRIEGGVTHARPYNAPAKVIESCFASLERGPFAMIPGYVGGDRMTKKTANVGRLPSPFPGSSGDLKRALSLAVDYYNGTPLTSGHLKRKSPRQAYEAHLAAGWQHVAIDSYVLEAVFSNCVLAKVDRGRIKVRGEEYYADDLLEFSGRRVQAHVPKIGDRAKIAVTDQDHHLICFASLETSIPFGEVAGAREQSRRARLANANVASLRSNIDTISPLEEMERVVWLQGPALTATAGGRVQLAEQTHELADARRALPPSETMRSHKLDARRQRMAVRGALKNRTCTGK